MEIQRRAFLGTIGTGAEAEKKAMGFVLPGVIMQPSGVFAALRAQEAGCAYILAS